jgi:hypothetical protein
MNNSFENKYKRYKLKYLQLRKMQQGGYIPYTNDQKILHKLLNSFDTERALIGPTCVMQWNYNDTDNNTVSTVTLFGEMHFHYDSFFREQSTKMRFLTGKTMKAYNNLDRIPGMTYINDIYQQQLFFIIELFWYIFKGTRRCIDFYLEDWLLNRATLESHAIKNAWDLTDISSEYEFTMPNLIRMMNNDLYILNNDDRLRRNVKKFSNVRCHKLEYRKPGRVHIILPYSNDDTTKWFHVIPGYQYNDFYDNITSIGQVAGENINTKKIRIKNNIQNYLKLMKEFSYCVSGLDYTDDLYGFLSGRNNNKDFEETYNDLKLKLERKYTEIMTMYNMPYFNRKYQIITADRNTFSILAKRILKNLWKCDTITHKKYVRFVKQLFNLDAIYLSIIQNYADIGTFFGEVDIIKIMINPKILINILTYVETLLMDMFAITRNLKTFSINNQSKNLQEESLCFNNNGIRNRNIVAYTGSAHTVTYMFFYTYYFKSLPHYSISSPGSHLNGFFYNYYDGTRLLNEIPDKNNINYYCDKLWLQSTLQIYESYMGQNVLNIKYDQLFWNIKTDSNNLHIDFNISNNPIILNNSNILKKILVNICKENDERLRLLTNITQFENLDIYNSSYVKQILDNINNWYTNYNNYDNFSDHVINTNGIAIKPFNLNEIDGVIVNNNYYKANELYAANLPNSKLNFADTISSDQRNIDSIQINSILTDLVNEAFFASYKSKLTFITFVYKTIKNSLEQWEMLRFDYYADKRTFPMPNRRIVDVADTREVKYNKISYNIAQYPLVKLLFKGGMTLRLLYFLLKKQFNILSETQIEKSFSEYFKISDFDFEVKIKYKDPDVYDEIYNEVTLLISIILKELADLFNDPKYKNQLFDFENIEYVERENMMKKYLDKLNELQLEKYVNIKRFDNLIASKNIGTPSETIDLIENSVNIYNTQHNIIPIDGHILIDSNNAMGIHDILNNTKKSIVIIENKIPTENKQIVLNKINIPNYTLSPDEIAQLNIHDANISLSDIIDMSDPIETRNVYDQDKFMINFINKHPRIYKNNTSYKPYQNVGSFYSLWNPEIKLIKSKFMLGRIKHNFNIIGHYKSTDEIANVAGAAGEDPKKSFLLSKSGEVIDVSMGYRDSWVYKIHDKMDYTEFSLDEFKYNSYSLQGHICDLLIVLYLGNYSQEDIDTYNVLLNEINYTNDYLLLYNVPWENNKYNKRLNRLMILSFFERLIKLQNINMRNHLNFYNKMKHTITQIVNRVNTFNNNGIFNNATCSSLLTEISKLLIKFLSKSLRPNQKFNNKNLNAAEKAIQSSSINNYVFEPRELIISGNHRNNKNINIKHSFIQKFNYLKSISGIYSFIYLNIKLIEYLKINIRRGRLLNKVMERDNGELQISLFYKKLLETINIIIEFIHTSLDPRFPTVTTLDPTKLS